MTTEFPRKLLIVPVWCNDGTASVEVHDADVFAELPPGSPSQRWKETLLASYNTDDDVGPGLYLDLDDLQSGFTTRDSQ